MLAFCCLPLERNIGYDPFSIPCGDGGSQLREVRELAKAGRAYVVARGPGGEVYVLGAPDRGGHVGRVFRGGGYVRTFWPVSAKDVQALIEDGTYDERLEELA